MFRLDVNRFPFFFYLSVLPYLLFHIVHQGASYPPELFRPQGLFNLIPIPMPGRQTMTLLAFLDAIALVLSARYGRTFYKVLAFALFFYIFGVRYNYGYWLHLDAGTTVALAVMATAKPEERWPIRFITVYWIFIFFSAGLHKLYDSGWSWAASDPIAQILWRDRYWSYPDRAGPISSFSVFLIQSGLSKILGWYVLILELISPIAFLSRRAYIAITVQLTLALLGIEFLIDRHFFLAMLPLMVAAFFHGLSVKENSQKH